MQHQDFVILCYAVGTFLAVAFAAYAFWYGRLLSKKAQNTDTEAFLTARGTQSIWRVGWSFYAGAVGAWVVVAPSQVHRNTFAAVNTAEFGQYWQLPWMLVVVIDATAAATAASGGAGTITGSGSWSQ